uniref:(northern house mosquito) hypothetical protein n=1 Tax=Culex pipiens TaxID=7175 RepID=A0A8D8ERS3_CULPI
MTTPLLQLMTIDVATVPNHNRVWKLSLALPHESSPPVFWDLSGATSKDATLTPIVHQILSPLSTRYDFFLRCTVEKVAILAQLLTNLTLLRVFLGKRVAYKQTVVILKKTPS